MAADAPVCLAVLFLFATGLCGVTIFRPALAPVVAGYLAVVAVIVLAGIAWGFARTNQENLEATREALAFIRAESEANRPTVAIEIAKAWFDVTGVGTSAAKETTAVLIHLRATFTNSSKSFPTTITAKAAFAREQPEESRGMIQELTFFRSPRPHQLMVPAGDVIESTVLISAETSVRSPEQLEIELTFSHPFEARLSPFRLNCPRLGTVTAQLNAEERRQETTLVAP